MMQIHKLSEKVHEDNTEEANITLVLYTLMY